MKTTNKLILCVMFILVPFYSNANVFATDDSDRERFQQILEQCDRLKNSGQVSQSAQYYVNHVKNWSTDDDEFLYLLAKVTDELRTNLNKYNWSLASTTNMYNAAAVMAESYNISLLEIELNAMRIQFAIQASQMGNQQAVQLLQLWGMQAQINNSSNGYQNNNSYQNNGNNESRKRQLLNNIATYEKRIQEVQSQMGNGIATNMMGNQTISNYRRMIEDAKRELRSMGYNIY